MEFLRFAGSIPGSCWGCCAADVIQCFDKDPDSSASIQIVCGDEGQPLYKDGEQIFFGPTYREIFLNRIRTGTFGRIDLPNHAFFAILTESQAKSSIGKKWMELLNEQGFEFLRAVDNSVYSSTYAIDDVDSEPVNSPRPVYVFALFRNIGRGYVDDPFDPPQYWSELNGLKVGDLTDRELKERHLKVWHDHGPTRMMTRSEIDAAGCPVILAGKRSENPQEPEETRIERNGEEDEVDPFSGDIDIYDEDEEYV